MDSLIAVLSDFEVRYKHVAAELRVLLADRSKHGMQLLRDAVFRYDLTVWPAPSVGVQQESFAAEFDDAEVHVSHGRTYSRTALVKAAAEQDGSAHESDAIDLSFWSARETNIGGRNFLVGELVVAARLALKWGFRVMDAASVREGYVRRQKWPPREAATFAFRAPLPLRQGSSGFDTKALELTPEGTILGWFSRRALAERPTRLMNQQGQSSHLSLGLTTANELRATLEFRGSEPTTSTTRPLSADEVKDWNHLAVTWQREASRVSVYFNGKQLAPLAE